MGRSVKKTIYVLLAITLLSQTSVYALIRQNDYTKAYRSFDSRYNSERSDFNKKNWESSSKRAESKKFTSPDNAASLTGKRPSKVDSTMVDKMQSSKFEDSKKSFDTPDLKGFKKDWNSTNKEWKPKNETRDISKKYEGNIDFKKRSEYVDYLKEAYADMNERSMQDINKYQFRSSHSSEAGIKNTKAGADIQGDEDESFYESLFGSDNVERKPVRLFGPKNRNAVKREDDEAQSQTMQLPVGEVRQPAPTTRYMPPLIRDSNSSPTGNIAPEQSKSRKKTTVAEEEIDMNKAKNFRFMNIPENMRGKATIKVEVDNGEF